MLIHSLAHAVIDQWALDSGYPASSLRERLYVDDDMAGFLIYTATSDSAGSLGGVIAEAEPDRLEASFRELAARTAWCSADPLCVESGPNGVDGLNLAACHSCMLLPESQLRGNEPAAGPGPARRVALSARPRIPAAERIREAEDSMAKMLPATVREDTSSPAEHAMFAHMRDELSGEWTVLHSLGLTIHHAEAMGRDRFRADRAAGRHLP